MRSIIAGADLLQIIADYRAHARERLDKAAGALMSHCFTRLPALSYSGWPCSTSKRFGTSLR